MVADEKKLDVFLGYRHRLVKNKDDLMKLLEYSDSLRLKKSTTSLSEILGEKIRRINQKILAIDHYYNCIVNDPTNNEEQARLRAYLDQYYREDHS